MAQVLDLSDVQVVPAVLLGLNTDNHMLENLRDTFDNSECEDGCLKTLSKCNIVALMMCIDGVKRNERDPPGIAFKCIKYIGPHALKTLCGYSRSHFFVIPCPGCGVIGQKCSHDPLTNIQDGYFIHGSVPAPGIPDSFNTF